jgi:hypothetical protein
MKDFKNFLSEKNRLMQKYDSGEINIMSYKIPEKKGKDYDYDNTIEILKALGISDNPSKIINNFIKEVSKIPYGRKPETFKDEYTPTLAKDIQALNSEWGLTRFIEDTMDVFTGKWSIGSLAALRYNDNEKEVIEFYSNKKNYDETVKKLKSLKKYGKYMNNFINRQKQKAEAKLGIKWDDIVEGFKYIDYFRSGSKRKLSKDLWPFLQAITVKAVDKKKLPKTVYRGYFIDGNKLDPKQDYSKGAKIKMKNTKATSWSTSIGMAIEFSHAQDFIKDRDGGYQIVVKYDIKNPYEDIIADFRVFSGMNFYNQQEIVISTKVKEAEIVEIVKGDEYDNDISKRLPDVQKFGDSAWGFKFNDYLASITRFKDSNLSLEDKINLKKVFNKTLGEVMKEYPDIIKNKNIGCLKKVNAYLGIVMADFGSVAKGCSYTGFNAEVNNVYLDSKAVKFALNQGIKSNSKYNVPLDVSVNIYYEIIPNGYNSKVIVHIKEFEIKAKPDENYKENSKQIVELRKAVLNISDKDLLAWLPGNLAGFSNLEIRRPKN